MHKISYTFEDLCQLKYYFAEKGISKLYQSDHYKFLTTDLYIDLKKFKRLI